MRIVILILDFHGVVHQAVEVGAQPLMIQMEVVIMELIKLLMEFLLVLRLTMEGVGFLLMKVRLPLVKRRTY
jgi:hypothetical protein